MSAFHMPPVGASQNSCCLILCYKSNSSTVVESRVRVDFRVEDANIAELRVLKD
jgi:hypothetical protein